MNDVKQIAEKIVARGASINPLYVCGEIVSVPELAAAYLDLLKRTESHVLRSPEPKAKYRITDSGRVEVNTSALVFAEVARQRGERAPTDPLARTKAPEPLGDKVLEKVQALVDQRGEKHGPILVSPWDAKEVLDIVRRLQAELKTAQDKYYPHMCRDEHVEIGHRDSDNELCPMCRVTYERDDLRAQLQTAEQREKEAAREWLHLDAARQMLIEERDGAKARISELESALQASQQEAERRREALADVVRQSKESAHSGANGTPTYGQGLIDGMAEMAEIAQAALVQGKSR